MKLQRIILIVAGVMVIVGGFYFTNLGENLVKIIYQQLFIYRSSRTPINFYGKVIDENGKPVPWAEVKVSISNPGHRIYGKNEELRSDAKGDFQILGKRGYSISIYVDSADHHKTESAHQTFDYVFVGRSQPPFPTEYKPAIFVLKRRGMPAVLDGVYDKKIMLPLDGQPAIINLANGNETLGPNS